MCPCCGTSTCDGECCDVLVRLMPDTSAVPVLPGRWLTWVP
jgi:hypothetical protein